MPDQKYRKAFDLFCERHKVTAAERPQLVEFLAFITMQRVRRALLD